MLRKIETKKNKLKPFGCRIENNKEDSPIKSIGYSLAIHGHVHLEEHISVSFKKNHAEWPAAKELLLTRFDYSCCMHIDTDFPLRTTNLEGVASLLGHQYLSDSVFEELYGPSVAKLGLWGELNARRSQLPINDHPEKEQHSPRVGRSV